MKMIVHIPVEITVSGDVTEKQIEGADLETVKVLYKTWIKNAISNLFTDIDQINVKPKIFILEK